MGDAAGAPRVACRVAAVSGPALDGWVPVRVHWQAQGPMVEWCYFGGERLVDPFFEATLRFVMERPFRATFHHVTPIEVMEERAASHPGIAPSGFIFHLSRCGSTLISRMLAASPANVVVSEAPCVDELIWAGAWLRGLRVESLVRWVRSLITALGQPRGGGETRYFVKFGALQALALPLIRLAFPETPWIFVYREPVEVLVSLSKACPAFATPGVSNGGFFPIPPAEAQAMHPDEYAARLLGMIATAAAQRIEAGDGIGVNYAELPGAMWPIVSSHFRCQWQPGEAEAMSHTLRFHAKFPSTLFAPDSESKQREAGMDLRTWADRWAGDAYRRLEAARRDRNSATPP